MLYLLGGAARSGKSIIAKRILAESRIPFFCLDNPSTSNRSG
jgi:adenosyl cobinamide kinase/adenosyl cobinamide phosphate guanylyltransferase